MRESLYLANQELKRAEHLLYVSLKYTRTGDVIKSIIARLIACFDFIMDGMIKKREAEVKEVANSPFAKVALLKQLYDKNKQMHNFLEFYILMRKITRAESEAFNEFRRNLTLKCNLDGKHIEITIDIIGDYYHRTVEFLRYIKDTHLLDEKQ